MSAQSCDATRPKKEELAEGLCAAVGCGESQWREGRLQLVPTLAYHRNYVVHVGVVLSPA